MSERLTNSDFILMIFNFSTVKQLDSSNFHFINPLVKENDIPSAPHMNVNMM